MPERDVGVFARRGRQTREEVASRGFGPPKGCGGGLQRHLGSWEAGSGCCCCCKGGGGRERGAAGEGAITGGGGRHTGAASTSLAGLHSFYAGARSHFVGQVHEIVQALAPTPICTQRAAALRACARALEIVAALGGAAV